MYEARIRNVLPVDGMVTVALMQEATELVVIPSELAHVEEIRVLRANGPPAQRFPVLLIRPTELLHKQPAESPRR